MVPADLVVRQWWRERGMGVREGLIPIEGGIIFDELGLGFDERFA